MLTTHIKRAKRIHTCLIYLNPTYLSIQDQSLLKAQRIQLLTVVDLTGGLTCYTILQQHQGYGSCVLYAREFYDIVC